MRRVCVTEQHGIFTVENLTGVIGQSTDLERALRAAFGSATLQDPGDIEIRSVYEASEFVSAALGPESHLEQIHTRVPE